jgi:hypothetical protein
MESACVKLFCICLLVCLPCTAPSATANTAMPPCRPTLAAVSPERPLLRICGGGKVRFDPRQLVRREGEDYPAPGSPAADSECRGDPILQHLQSITVELDADSPEGRRLLSTAPVPRILDSEGDSVEVELLHQEPCVVLNPESAAEDLRPAIVARRLWEAAEVSHHSSRCPFHSSSNQGASAARPAALLE